MHITQMIRNLNPVLLTYDHIPRLIISSKLIPPAAKLVYGALLKYAPDHKDTCWPGIKSLARDVGMDYKTVTRAITILESAQLLFKTPRQDAKGRHSNLYTLLPFPDVIISEHLALLNVQESPDEEDTTTYENHTTPLSQVATPPPPKAGGASPQVATRSIISEVVKDCQPAPSVPRAPLATQTTRAGGVEPLGGASAKPKAPPIDPNVVITKIREAKDGAALTLESKECWTACLAIWESLYSRKMNEADKKMLGGIIKDTSIELVGRTFVDLLDGDILPPDWPYIIACVTSKRNKDAYKQVRKDNERLLTQADVDELCRVHGIYESFRKYFELIPVLDAEGNKVHQLPKDRKYRQLQRIVH